MLDDDRCFAALTRRDPGADGLFFVGVRTTGIYCRPICPARIPLRRNLAFFRTAAAAQAAGLRPCLRCRPESAPDSPAWLGSMAVVNRALRLIDEGFLVDARLDALSARVGLTPRHLRRLFEKHIGVGPIAIEQTRRIHLAKKLLHETAMPITDVAFAAGFGSVRRFNERFRELFGRAPSEWRRARPSGVVPGSVPGHVQGRSAGGAAPAAQAGLPVSVGLAYRPPLDWDACLRRAASRGARIDGGTIRLHIAVLAPATPPLGGFIEIVPGPRHALQARLHDVPIALLARTIVLAKRTVFSDLGSPDTRPVAGPAARQIAPDCPVRTSC